MQSQTKLILAGVLASLLALVCIGVVGAGLLFWQVRTHQVEVKEQETIREQRNKVREELRKDIDGVIEKNRKEMKRLQKEIDDDQAKRRTK